MGRSAASGASAALRSGGVLPLDPVAVMAALDLGLRVGQPPLRWVVVLLLTLSGSLQVRCSPSSAVAVGGAEEGWFWRQLEADAPPSPRFWCLRQMSSAASQQGCSCWRLWCEELKIDFKRYDHPVVLTVEEQAKHVGNLGGALTKNLLLKDKKHRLYIVSALADTKVDMKILSQRLGLGKGGVRMAPEDNLRQVLQVPLGCVTPFALFNESASDVSLLLDQGFKSKQSCYFHPLTNDVTIALSSSSLDKFLLSLGKQPAYVDLEASPVVGKDNPPDLADLVPSGALSFPEESVENVEPTPAQTKNVPKEKTCLPDVKAKLQVQNKAASSSESKVPTDGANVEKFVTDVLQIISPRFISEVSKKLNIKEDEISPILDGFKERAALDVESLASLFKSTAYTAGFHAGFEVMLNHGLSGMPSRK